MDSSIGYFKNLSFHWFIAFKLGLDFTFKLLVFSSKKLCDFTLNDIFVRRQNFRIATSVHRVCVLRCKFQEHATVHMSLIDLVWIDGLHNGCEQFFEPIFLTGTQCGAFWVFEHGSELGFNYIFLLLRLAFFTWFRS